MAQGTVMASLRASNANASTAHHAAQSGRRSIAPCRATSRELSKTPPPALVASVIPPASRHSEAGVTLVEILVVLSIIAITTGAAMLRLGLGGSGDDLTSAATTLALAVTSASDAAMATGQDRLLEFGAVGYRLTPVGSDSDTWHPLPGLTLTRADGGTDALRLSSDAASPPFQLRLTGEGNSLSLRFDGLQAKVEAAP